MAQKVNIILVDDLDGTEATETIEFGLDGNKYEIDLNADNAKALREAIAKFTAAGRRTVARRGRPKATPAAAAPKATGSRSKRTATVEEIEASKSK